MGLRLEGSEKNEKQDNQMGTLGLVILLLLKTLSKYLWFPFRITETGLCRTVCKDWTGHPESCR